MIQLLCAPFRPFLYLSTYVTLVTFPSIISELASMAAIRPNGLHSSNGCTTIGILGLNTTSAWSPASMYGTPSTLALLVLFPIFQLIAVIWHGALAVINWKMGKSTSNAKVEGVPYIEAGDQAEVVFAPKMPIVVQPFDACKPLGRIAAMDSNSLKMLGKVTKA